MTDHVRYEIEKSQLVKVGIGVTTFHHGALSIAKTAEGRRELGGERGSFRLRGRKCGGVGSGRGGLCGRTRSHDGDRKGRM